MRQSPPCHTAVSFPLFLSTSGATTRTVVDATPFTYAPVTVFHVPVGKRVDLATCTTSDDVLYKFSASHRAVTSSQGKMY